MVLAGMFYLIIAAVPLGIAYLLWAYAQRIASFLRRPEPRKLESALQAQKTYWQVVGILALIGVVIQVGGMLLMILGLMGAMAAMGG
jgi:hypothetical protein